MKKSTKISLAALVIGPAVTVGLLLWLLPGMHWGIYVGAGVVGAALANQAWLSDSAQRKAIDCE
tara:strand:- start:1559 stop:1750 length:192 start_codon:yes stop_codon:yes gene_type:complete